MKIYLDDVRIPTEKGWTIVRTFDEFVSKVNDVGLENIKLISLDHDLDKTAMQEWVFNTFVNYKINYDNIKEKTGLDCAKWLVEQWNEGKPVVKVVVHSANAVGSGNIMGYINHFKHTKHLLQDCYRVDIQHTIDEKLKEKLK